MLKVPERLPHSARSAAFRHPPQSLHTQGPRRLHPPPHLPLAHSPRAGDGDGRWRGAEDKGEDAVQPFPRKHRHGDEHRTLFISQCAPARSHDLRLYVFCSIHMCIWLYPVHKCGFCAQLAPMCSSRACRCAWRRRLSDGAPRSSRPCSSQECEALELPGPHLGCPPCHPRAHPSNPLLPTPAVPVTSLPRRAPPWLPCRPSQQGSVGPPRTMIRVCGGSHVENYT